MIQTTNQLKLCWVEIIILFLVDPIVIISQRGMCAAQSTPGFPKKNRTGPQPLSGRVYVNLLEGAMQNVNLICPAILPTSWITLS